MKLRNKLYGPIHYKLGGTCVYKHWHETTE